MPSLITRGVKASSRKKLIELAKANARRQLAADKKEALAHTNQIEAAHAPFRLAFRKDLEKHPDGKAVRKECDDAIKAIQALVKRRPTNAQQLEKELESIRKILDGIDKQHGDMLREAAQRVTSKRRAYLGAIIKAFEKRGRIELRERRYGGLAMKFINWAELEPWEPSPQTSFVLEPPFDADAVVTETFSALLGGGVASAVADSGHVSASGLASTAGYHMSRAQIGAFLTIPAGFSTLKLQARITDVSATVTAFALGASWASSGGIAEITSLANNAVIRRENSINYVVAPLVFYARDEFNGPHPVNAEFDIPDDGGEILVTAGLKSDVWGALAGGGVATNFGDLSKITVEIS